MTLSARRPDRPAPLAPPHPRPPQPSPSTGPSPWTGPARWTGPAGWAEASPWAGARPVDGTPEHAALAWRLAGHLLLAALPLLAISAHVFDLVPMHLTAGLLVIPLLVAVVIGSMWRPLEQDRMLLRAAVVGAIATAVYDTIRLDTVYLLGWWGDFIPSIGAWILNADDPVTGLVERPGLAATVVGYLWRYAGDGAGIGVWFYVLAAALGLRDRGPGITIGAAVAFAVAPVWAGLIATVGLAPRAPELMFPLTARTLALSLLGHLIFGLVLGIGAARADRLDRLWPWPRPPIPGLDAALHWLQDRTAHPVPANPSYARSLSPGGWSAAVTTASPHLAVRPGEVTQMLPPTIELRTGRCELTDLVAPIRAALPPPKLRPTPTPTPTPAPAAAEVRAGPVRALPRGDTAEQAQPAAGRAGSVSGPCPPAPRPVPPSSGPVPLPRRHPDPRPTERHRERLDAGPAPRLGPPPSLQGGHPVAWGSLSRLGIAEVEAAP